MWTILCKTIIGYMWNDKVNTIIDNIYIMQKNHEINTFILEEYQKMCEYD